MHKNDQRRVPVSHETVEQMLAQLRYVLNTFTQCGHMDFENGQPKMIGNAMIIEDKFLP